MAVFKSYGTAAIGATPLAIYSPSQKSIVIGLAVSNVFGYASSITVKLNKSGDGAYTVVPNRRIDAGVYVDLMAGNKLVLESGDTLTAFSSDASAFEVVVSVLEGVA